MARKPDERLREDALRRVVAYLYEHGLTDLSLRPLGAEIGISARMLLYYFGSKEELLARAVVALRPQVDDTFAGVSSAAELGRVATAEWRDLVAPDNRRPAALLLQVAALAPTLPGRYGAAATEAVHGWLQPATGALRRTGWKASEAAARATVLTSGMRGIALDFFVTGDGRRTTAAARRLIEAVTVDPS